jgi:hypothetical protein
MSIIMRVVGGTERLNVGSPDHEDEGGDGVGNL